MLLARISRLDALLLNEVIPVVASRQYLSSYKPFFNNHIRTQKSALVLRTPSSSSIFRQRKLFSSDIKSSTMSKPENDENQTANQTTSVAPRRLSIEPNLPRYSAAWWKEITIICTVFAITGSSAAYLVKPFLLHVLNMQGSLMAGPWSFRIAYLTFMMPMYSTILLLVGTVFGRHTYFKKFVIKMWARFLPKSVLDKLSDPKA
eukprot:TRINITY_DN92_c0_g1_i1.p1 TRINITY_DN92_c0_g1~~TRINITY_DN92_c0_g1_i1.p1  ORF type:complete len:204 (-),score=4.06 TRINITY_DN92_c0_g1_i1:20-631(-)